MFDYTPVRDLHTKVGCVVHPAAGKSPEIPGESPECASLVWSSGQEKHEPPQMRKAEQRIEEIGGIHKTLRYDVCETASLPVTPMTMGVMNV